MNLLKKLFRSDKVCTLKRTEWEDEVLPPSASIDVLLANVDGTMFHISQVYTTHDIYQVVDAVIEMNARSTATHYASVAAVQKRVHAAIWFGTKPLSRHPIALSEYGIVNMSQLTLTFYGGLGGAILLPTYSHVAECEKMVCDDMKLQSFVLRNPFTSDQYISDYALKLVEDVSILAYHIVGAQKKVDYAVAVLNFVKLRSCGPIIRHDLVQNLTQMVEEALQDGMSRQAEEFQPDVFASARGFLDDYEAFKNGPLASRLYKLAMYCLANELFDGVGITLTKLNYSKLSQEALRREYHLGPSFIHCLMDTMLFICEQGVQCVKLGSIEPLIHGPKTYQEWFDKAMELQVKSKCLANPKPHGFTKFDFLKDLGEAITKGEAISKYATHLGTSERKLVRSVLSSLMMLQADCITKGAAQKTRKAPFAILVYAGSSVGKSTFTDILFTYHGKIAGLPQGSEYRYAVNFADEYQSGFTTNQWCWLIDDIAFQSPGSAQGVDTSLMNVIQANNNAAYITNQADLPDKGRIPMWCDQVIGTTNVKHLNASYYFSNPLAVQRRFPFVVELKPKEEYAKDGCMLDGQKVKMVGANEYPNWWEIIVWRVIPKVGCLIENQVGDYELELKTSEISTFLMWYHDTWVKYDAQQEKVLEGNSKFDHIELCDCHHLPLAMCTDVSELVQQAVEYCDEGYLRDGKFFPYSERFPKPNSPVNVQVDEPTVEFTLEEEAEGAVNMFRDEAELEKAWKLGWTEYFTVVLLQWGMYFFLEFVFFRQCISWCYSFPILRNLFWRVWWSKTRDSRVISHVFRFMGRETARKIGSVPFLLTMATLLSSGIMTYKLASWLWSGSKVDKLQAVRREGSTPTAHEERGENVWYKNDFVLTTFDLPLASQSLVGQEERLHSIIQKEVVKVRCFTSSTTAVDQTLLALGGQYYLANNHGIPQRGSMRIHYVQAPTSGGVTSNIEMTLDQCNIMRYPERDLCILRLKNVPPKAGVMKFVASSAIESMCKGVILRRDFCGISDVVNVTCAKSKLEKVPTFDRVMRHWRCAIDRPTKNGDCGSPLVIHTAKGPVIVGIHTLGDERNQSLCVSIDTNFLRCELDKLQLSPVNVAPNLKTQSIEHKLGVLHPKSVFRYLEQGSAQVFGSFVGFKASLKSRVVETVLCDAVCAKFGVQLKHGKPVMKGWKPWRLAAAEMVQPTTLINEDVLGSCVDAFTTDILTKLPASELKLLQVYDIDTVVNGAMGVKYVNAMPRNTSMGFPWRKSKKYFMHPVSTENAPEGMMFEPEILARAEAIEEQYLQGMRCAPVFTAHLKDEATKFKKIDSGKTRVFTGAPVDWSLVVRKYFLSAVRVISRNKLLFEAGPGTNCQSVEWDQIGKHLIQHGEDRLIAGDYAAFDKSMPPSVILAAFQVLINLCIAAGYTPDDVKVLYGIANDTAFPMVDFNGDLVQFYGSNPSGHPLTVIINGLANSLYMRYCYYYENPAKECTSFQKHVALMTYGDDNVMGVSVKASWFNHTSIQQRLASVGITYTMADKETASIPFISLSDVSFLKRTWRFDEEFGCMMAPLEEDSIFKMLTIGVASGTICAEAQAIAIVECALNEWFFYGREIFESRRLAMMDIVEQCDLEEWVEKTTFPTWAVLADRFQQNSKSFL